MIDIQRHLKKIVSLATTQQQYRLSEVLKCKPFWIWDKQQHKQEGVKAGGDCCFNHIIGLPTKEEEEKAIFDYEKILYDALLDNDNSIHTFKHKHLWVKKATGLGVTEFFLRLEVTDVYCNWS